MVAPVALDRNKNEVRTYNQGQGFTTAHHKLGDASDTAGQEEEHTAQALPHSSGDAVALHENCGVHKQLC